MCVVCGSVCVSLGVCVYVCVCNMKGYVLCSLDAQMQSSRYFSIDENPLLVKIYTFLDWHYRSFSSTTTNDQTVFLSNCIHCLHTSPLKCVSV